MLDKQERAAARRKHYVGRGIGGAAAGFLTGTQVTFSVPFLGKIGQRFNQERITAMQRGRYKFRTTTQPIRAFRMRLARRIANALAPTITPEQPRPKAGLARRALRSSLKLLSRGRRKTLYHTTAAENIAPILKEGLRVGKGGTFNRGGGQTFLGTPFTVAVHDVFGEAARDMRALAVRVPRRARLLRDLQHAGAWTFEHPHLPAKLIRPVSNLELYGKAGLTGLGWAAAGAGAAMGISHLAYRHPRFKKIDRAISARERDRQRRFEKNVYAGSRPNWGYD